MASINYAARQISVKIVYYGPGLSGKTTNLQVIHKKTPQEHRSDMVSLATETDRTLFFDFLPLDLGKIKGFDTKFQLYTVPGQVYYNATRKLVLRGVDGVVFVADSGADKIQENLESFQNLEDNLAEYGYQRESIPIIIQYNKRDLPNALPIEELNRHINKYNLPYGEGIAYKGVGVFDTLKQIGKIVIDYLNKKYSRGAGARNSPAGPAPAAPQSFTAPAMPAAPAYQVPATPSYVPPPVAPPPAPAYQAAAVAFAPPSPPGYQQPYDAQVYPASGTPSYAPPPAPMYQAPPAAFVPPPAQGYQQPLGANPYAAPQQQYQTAPQQSFEPAPAPQAAPLAEPQSFEPAPAPQAAPWAEPQSFEPAPAPQASPWAEPQSFEPAPAPQASPWAEPQSFEPAPAPQASPVLDQSNPWGAPPGAPPPPTTQQQGGAEQSPFSFEMTSPQPSSLSGFDSQIGGNEFDLSGNTLPTGGATAPQGNVSYDYNSLDPLTGTATQGDGLDLDQEIEMYQRKIEEQQKSMRTGGTASFPAVGSDMQPYSGPSDNNQPLSPFDPQANVSDADTPAYQNNAYCDFEAELTGSLARESLEGDDYPTADSAMCFTSVDKNAARKPGKPPVNPAKIKAAQQQQKGFGLPKLFNKNK